MSNFYLLEKKKKVSKKANLWISESEPSQTKKVAKKLSSQSQRLLIKIKYRKYYILSKAGCTFEQHYKVF